ncbi:protein kinase [Streptomyces sp. NPDC048558]|uniref:protein kinase domain-containing protein n=1 Tax=Streptomyces sp. NPDC048558 TaxID=3155759 RepID=UPI0034479E6C
MRSGEEFAGRYVLEEVIGAGRGGEVWRAHDRLVGQGVALKPERIEGDRETAVRRLLGEPRAMAKFRDHPHVVTLFAVVTVPAGDDWPETYWFVMEYVPGGGLDRQPRMSPQRAARVGAQLADALAALHGTGIVHCDVKPGRRRPHPARGCEVAGLRCRPPGRRPRPARRFLRRRRRAAAAAGTARR